MPSWNFVKTMLSANPPCNCFTFFLKSRFLLSSSKKLETIKKNNSWVFIVTIERDSLSKLGQNVSIHILNQMTILKWCYMYSCPSLQNASALDLSSLSSHQSLQSSFLQWAPPSNLSQPVPLMSFSPPNYASLSMLSSPGCLCVWTHRTHPKTLTTEAYELFATFILVSWLYFEKDLYQIDR